MINYIQFGMLSLVGMALIVIASITIENIINSLDKMLIPCQHGTVYVGDECLCAGTPFTGQYCETCTCKNGFCIAGGGTTPTSSIYGCKCDTGTKFWGRTCQLCNTVGNIVEVQEGLPDLSLDIHRCELYAENNGYQFNNYFQNNPDTNLCNTNPQGCYVVNNEVFFNGCGTTDIECNRPDINEAYKCIQQSTNCTGNCSSPFYGPLCDKVCFEDVLYESTFTNTSGKAAICAITRESGGFCDVCNGHGTCAGNGCECDENWHSVGLDKCSVTCGSVNGKTCNGQGACVLYGNKPYCSCAYGWKGELCDIPCPGVEDTNVPCSNNGICKFNRDTEQTSCECNQKFRGEFCEIECPGDTVACNGHGVCNEVGQCTCDTSPTVWNGNACNCSSPISCNGHGFCDDGICQCDFEYEPANNCLDCKKHFFGSTCQFTCNPNGPLPSIQVLSTQPTLEKYKITIGLNPLEVYDGTTKLSGNKNIFHYQNNFLVVASTEVDNDLIIGDVATHKSTYSLVETSGTFVLIKGVAILYEGSTGWIQLDNYGPWVGQENNIGCHENGVCLVENFGLSTESIKCKCNENSVQKYFDGLFAFYSSTYSQEEYCKTCEPEYFPSIDIFNNAANKDHLDSLQIYVECQLKCNVHTCNNFGICNENFGIPGEQLCNCDGNVKDSSYCTECEDDWYPAIIAKGQPACNVYCNAATTCNGNGVCNDEGMCLCDEGYTGNECQIKCLINGLECSGHGKCVTDELEFLLEHEISTNTLYKCKCDPQNEVEDQTADYYGEFCEFSCPLPPWKNALKCNDLGECKAYPIKDIDGTSFVCNTDAECKSNTDVSAIISTEFDWTNIKGPFCKKRDKPFSYTIESSGQPNIFTEVECKQAAAFLGLTYHSSPNAADRPKGCYYRNNNVFYNTNQNSINCDSSSNCIKKSTCTDSYDKSRCFEIMNLQRPDKSRSLNCTSDATCKAFLYDYDWKTWCDDYLQAETITVFNGCKGDFAQTFCPKKDIESYCQNYVDFTNGLVVPHISYCYEKDKAKYPFLISFEYGWDQGTALHDDVVDQFIEVDSKYRSLNLDTFDATNYCTTYMDSKKINVQQINENTRYLCDGQLRSSCKFKTKVESSEEWTPWSVICDLEETQYHNISDAIENRKSGCHLYENGPRIDLGLTNLNNGQACNSNSECNSGICKTNCCKKEDINCAQCNTNGECSECIHGTTYNGDHCEANLYKHLKYTYQASHSIECEDSQACDNSEHVKDDRSCLQYCDEALVQVTSSTPDLSVSEAECEAYGKSIDAWGSADQYSADPTGCFKFTGDNKVYYNTGTTTHTCSTTKICIQKKSFPYSNRLVLTLQAGVHSDSEGCNNGVWLEDKTMISTTNTEKIQLCADYCRQKTGCIAYEVNKDGNSVSRICRLFSSCTSGGSYQGYRHATRQITGTKSVCQCLETENILQYERDSFIQSNGIYKLCKGTWEDGIGCIDQDDGQTCTQDVHCKNNCVDNVCSDQKNCDSVLNSYFVTSGNAQNTASFEDCKDLLKKYDGTDLVITKPGSGFPNGCVFRNTYEWMEGSTNVACSDATKCVEIDKTTCNYEFYETSFGNPDLSMTEAECRKYAETDSISYYSGVYAIATEPKGCWLHTTSNPKKIYYNTIGNTDPCSDTFMCIQKSTGCKAGSTNKLAEGYLVKDFKFCEMEISTGDFGGSLSGCREPTINHCNEFCKEKNYRYASYNLYDTSHKTCRCSNTYSVDTTRTAFGIFDTTGCTKITCTKTWVEGQGCMDMISNINEAIDLIDKTCDQADSLFPQCPEPVSACDLNICNGEDTCTPDPLSNAGICETKKELDCTCKYGFECERLGFTKYKCKGNFSTGPKTKFVQVTTGAPDLSVSEAQCEDYATSAGKTYKGEWGFDSGNFPKGCHLYDCAGCSGNVYFNPDPNDNADCTTMTCIQFIEQPCHDLERDFDFVGYCKDNNPVVYYEKFDDFRVKESSQNVTGTFQKEAVEYIDFWVKTEKFASTSSRLEIYKNDQLLFYFYMNRGQFELNDPTSLQSCPADNPTCPELYTWIYEANVWYHLGISIDWTNQLATLIKGTDTKSSKFLIEPVIASTMNNFKIVEGSSKTYFDELIFEKALAIPDALKPCKDFAYCNFDVNYRSLCSDVLRKTQYPLNLEPQLDIIDICIDHHKTKTINIQASHAQEDEILALDWLSYCRFKDSIDYNYECGYIQVSFGTNDMSVSESECEAYGKSINKWGGAGSWDADPPGCFIQQLDDDKVYYNREASTVTCADRDYCIQKASHTNLENFKNCQSLIEPIDGDKTCVTNALSHDWTTECTNIDNRFIPPAIKSNCPEKCWTHFRNYDNCTNRTDLFETNRKLKDSTCDWTGFCFNSANNNVKGICAAVECDCNSEHNIGVSGESCQLSCPISSDGSACAEGSDMGFCTYNQEQQDIIEEAEKDNKNYEDGNLVAWKRELAYLSGQCKCFNSEGTNCDLECMACDNTSYATMIIGNKEYDALHGFCDKTSAKCECLAPYVGFKKENVSTWKGSHHTLISKVYGLPNNVDAETEIKIRMMQGKESFITNYLETSTDATNWTDAYDKFVVNPELYQCNTQACSQHDVMMLSDYDGTSARFNFNCKEDCPGIIANRIPCNGHGRCGIDGQCVCDRAKVYKGTDAQGAVIIMRIGDQTLRQGEVVSSRLDNTGWRGDDCSIKCPGYDEDLQSMENVCNGHGTCNDNGGCQCDLGYIGDQCQFRCPGFDNSDKNVCNGHGICELSTIEIVQKKVLRASQKCIGEWSDWSDCDGEYRTREYFGTCDQIERIDCSNETVACDGYYSDWSDCHLGYHYRKFHVSRQPKNGGIHCPTTTQRKECSDNDCIDPMCLYCDTTCFQCVENAVDIGFGCICKLGYRQIDNQCVKTLRKSYVSNDCTMENCAECESNYAVSEYVSISSEQAPDLSADKYDCESYATSVGKSFNTTNLDHVPKGCYYPSGHNTIYFNLHQTSLTKCSDTNACIQKAKYSTRSASTPQHELTQKECQDYANDLQKLFRLKYASDQPKGCWTNDNVYYFNTYLESTTPCSAEQKCVEKPTYTEITTGKNDGSVSEQECEILSREKFGSWVSGNIHDTPHEPSGCILIWQSSTNRYIYYYNRNTDGMTCGSKDHSNGVTTNYCVQKEKTTCKRCAEGTIYFPVRNQCMNLPCQTGMKWDSNQKKCVVSASEEDKDFQESVKESLDLYKGQCDQYKYIRNGRCNKYELVESGEPDLSVSKDECEEYRLESGLTASTFQVTSTTARPPGCYVYYDSTGLKSVHWNPSTNGANCDTSGSKCVQNKNKYKKVLDGIVYSLKTSGLPSSMTKQECEYYAIENKLNFEVKFDTQSACDLSPKGCLKDGNKVYFNGCGTKDVECTSSLNCVEKNSDNTCFTNICPIHDKFIQVNSGDPDLSVSENDCREYAEANSISYHSGVYAIATEPKGCWNYNDVKIYYNTNGNTNPCSDTFKCIKKTYNYDCINSTCVDMCIHACNEDDANKYKGISLSITGECICEEEVQTTCDAAIDVIQIKKGKNDMSLTQAECEVYAKSTGRTDFKSWNAGSGTFPQGCLDNNGHITYNPDTNDDVECGVVGYNCVIAKHKSYEPEFDTLYNDTKTGTCKTVDKEVFINVDLFLEKGTSEEVKGTFNCQVLSDNKVMCAECNCFNTEMYGKWSSFECETCEKGYGKKQCRDACPGYDGVNERSMCTNNGMCSFGSKEIDGERFFNNAQCVCGNPPASIIKDDNDAPLSAINPPVSMVVSSMVYTEFVTIAEEVSTVTQCQITDRVDSCYHFNDQDTACSTCQSSFSGKNCKYQCDKCLNQGRCDETPSDALSASCNCPTLFGLSTLLWNINCCPVGFIVPNVLKLNQIAYTELDDYPLGTTFDSTGYCQPCPGVSESQWLDSNAQYTVCGGIFRGKCIRRNTGLPANTDPIDQTWELACECNTGFGGSVCRCIDSLEKAFVNEQTDYGCYGRGTCSEIDLYQVELYKKEEKCTSTQHIISENYYDSIQECNKLCTTTYFSVDDYDSTKTSYTCNCCDTTQAAEGYNAYTRQSTTTKMYCIPNAGSYYKDGQVIEAEPGSYIDQSSKANVIFCPKGSYQNAAGQISCKLCPIGKYSDTKASTECKGCPGGKYASDGTETLTEGQTSISICKYNCPVATYGEPNQITQNCKTCTEGRYQNEEGQPSCTICPQGTFTKFGIIQVTFGTAKTTTSTYDLVESQCKAYQQAHSTLYTYVGESERKESAQHASGCHLDRNTNKIHFNRQNNDKECNEGDSVCIKDVNTPITCATCDPGKTTEVINGINKCVNCAAGRYSPGGTACKKCAKFSYQDEEGQVSCKSCKAGTYVPDVMAYSSSHYECADVQLLPNIEAEFEDNLALKKDIGIEQCAEYGRQYQCCPNKHKDQFIDCSHTYAYTHGSYVHKNFIDCEEAGFKWRSYCCEKLGNSINTGSNSLNIECDVSGTLSEDYRVAKTASECHSISTQAFWRKPSGMIYSNAVGTTEMNDIIYGATKEDPHCYLEVANPFSCFQKRNDEPLNGYFQGVMINYQLQGKGRCKNLRKVNKTRCMTPTSQVKGKTIFGFETGHLSATTGIGKTANVITGTGVNAGSTMTIFDFPPKQECTFLGKNAPYYAPQTSAAYIYYDTEGLTTCVSEKYMINANYNGYKSGFAQLTEAYDIYPLESGSVKCCYEEQGAERTNGYFDKDLTISGACNENEGGVKKFKEDCRNQDLRAYDTCLRTGPNAYLQPSCGCPNDAWDLIENLDNPTFQRGHYLSVGCKSQMGGNHEVWLYSIQSKIDELTADLTAASSEKHKIDADKTILNQNEPASFDASVRSCHQECLVKKDCTMFTVEDAQPFACFLLLKSLFCCNEGIQTYTEKTSGSPDGSLTLAHCVDYAYKQSLPFVEINNANSPKGCSKLGGRVQYNSASSSTSSCTVDDGLPLKTQFETDGTVMEAFTYINRQTYYCVGCTDYELLYDTNQNVDTYMPDSSGYFSLNDHEKYNSNDFKSSTLVTWCKNKCYQINKHYNGHKCQGIGIHPFDETGTQTPERCDLYLVEGSGLDIKENTVQFNIQTAKDNKWVMYGPIYSKGGACIEKDTYGRDCSHQGSEEETRTDGVCETVIDTIEECRVAAVFDRKRGVDAVSGNMMDIDSRKRDKTEDGEINFEMSLNGYPHGCFKGVTTSLNNDYIFNVNKNAQGRCYKGQADCRCKIVPLKTEETCLHPIESFTECNEALEEDKTKMTIIEDGYKQKVYFTQIGNVDADGLSEGECRQWAENSVSYTYNTQSGGWSDSSYSFGCIVSIVKSQVNVWYNKDTTINTCGARGFACVKKITDTTPNYYLTRWHELPDLSISFDECKEIAAKYGTNNWHSDDYSSTQYPTGCWYYVDSSKRFYYNHDKKDTFNLVYDISERGDSTEQDCKDFYNHVLNSNFAYNAVTYTGSTFALNCNGCITDTGIKKVDTGNVDEANAMAKGCVVKLDATNKKMEFYFNTNEVGSACGSDTNQDYKCVKKIEYAHNTRSCNANPNLFCVQRSLNYKNYDSLTMQPRTYKNALEPYGCILKDNKYYFNEEKTNVTCTSGVQCRCKTRSRQRSAQSYQECSLSDRHINTYRYGNQGMKIFGGGGEGNFHWSDPLDYYIRRMPGEAKATTFINDHALDPSFPSDECTKEHKIDHCYRECVEYEYFNVQDDGTCTCLYDDQYLPDIKGGSLDQCSETENIGWTYKIGYDGFEGMVSDEICYDCPIGKYNNGEVIKSVNSGSTKQSTDDMFMTSAECKLYTQSANYVWKGETADGTKPYGCIHHSKGSEKGDAYFNTDVTSVACGAYVGTDQIMCLQKDLSTTTSNFCLPCPVGKYGDEPGQTSCKTCPGGKYNSQKGAILKAGFRDPCIDCPRGLASMDGQEYCSAGCLPGYFIAGAVCAECWSGQYSDGGKVNKCKVAPPGMYLSGSTSRNIGLTSSSLRACPKGYYQDEAGKYDGGTNACDIATYGIVCKECPAGKFSYAQDIYNVDNSVCKLKVDNTFYDAEKTFELGITGYAECTCPEDKKVDENDNCIDCGRTNSVQKKGSSFEKVFLGTELTIIPENAYVTNSPDESICVCKNDYRITSLSDNTCIPCTDQTYSGQYDDFCIRCPAGYEKASTTSTSSLVQQRCNQCGPGRYRGETSPSGCQDCADGSAATAGSSFCTICEHESKPNADKSECKCVAGYRFYMENDIRKCEICQDGQYTDADNLASCKSCAAGQYADNLKKCTACPDGQYQPNAGQSSCLGGLEQTVTLSNTNVNTVQSKRSELQSAIATGISVSQDDVTITSVTEATTRRRLLVLNVILKYKVPPSVNRNEMTQSNLETPIQNVLSGVSISVSNVQQPVVCNGMVSVDKMQCIARCQIGNFHDSTNNNVCGACSAGTYQDQEGQTSCKSCASGYETLHNNNVIASGASQCNVCPAGKTDYDSKSSTQCQLCAAGYFMDSSSQSGVCKTCGSGSFTNTLASTGAESCTKCPVGTTDNDSTSSTQCQLCAIGKYMNAIGQSGNCDICGSGSYTNTLASTGAESCTLCPTGKKDGDGSSSTACQNCQPGTYQDVEGQTTCKNCEIGKYQDQVGQSSCTNCETNKYQDQVGQVSCKNCAAGNEARTASVSIVSSGATICTGCKVGEYDDDGLSSTGCKYCQQGQYQPSTGQTSCKLCEIGKYADQTGSVSGCTQCTYGKYQDQEGQTSCKECYSLTDTFMLGATNKENDCKYCTVGKYYNSNDKRCYDCPGGKYTTLERQASCITCGTGAYTPDTSSCITCPNGRYNDQFEQARCKLCTEQFGYYHDKQVDCMYSDNNRDSVSDCDFKSEGTNLQGFGTGAHRGLYLTKHIWTGWQQCFDDCVSKSDCEYMEYRKDADGLRCYLFKSSSGGTEASSQLFYRLSCNDY